MKEYYQVSKLIYTECANFQRFGPLGIRNYCWERENSNAGACVFFSSESPLCHYFEQAVLPLDEDLKKSLEEIKNAGAEDRAADTGSGSIEGLQSKPGNPAKVSVKRVSLDQYRGSSLLSRARIPGVAPQDPANDR